MTRTFALVILVFCLAACGDSGHTDPVCNDNVREGAEVCDGTDLAGQTCEGLSFTGGDLACADTCDAFDTTGCEGCADLCPTAGDTQCNGTVIETCTEQADTCNDWVAGLDCSTTADPFCDDTSEPAVCAPVCADQCPTAGETRCNVNVIQTCVLQADTCNDWVDTEDCADIDGTCDDSVDPAVCLPPCMDYCPGEGQTQCSGSVIQTCTLQLTGCVDWEDGQDCLDTGQTCDESNEPAVCVGGNPYQYDLVFSTYLGGSDWEHARDVYVDAQGYVTIVGGATSSDFPTTAGAYQRVQDMSGNQVGSGGYCDAFVAKFAPDGSLVWSTFLGGPNYDRAYAVEVDSDGYVYVAGRAGPGFPVTAGVFQDTFQGLDAGIYGMQNAFVAKIEPDGSDLVWASYAGVSTLSRDLAIDDLGAVYLAVGYPGQGPVPPTAWYANAYQSTPQGGTDSGAMKISADGTTVLWATFLGGSGDDSNAASIRVGPVKSVYITCYTDSTDIPTPNGADTTHNGGNDRYVARLTPDGSDLVYGTYVGGSGDEGLDTHNLAVDAQGNAYVSMHTTSSDFPATAGAFQESPAGGAHDLGIAKISPTGALVAATYFGGNGEEAPDGIYVDASGNVFVTGVTNSTNFPITPSTAYQTQIGGISDAVVILLSADFSSVLYATYMGGQNYDYGRSGFLDSSGNLYVTGSVDGTGWPTLNAYQDTYAGGVGSCYEGGCYAGDVILAKLALQ